MEGSNSSSDDATDWMKSVENKPEGVESGSVLDRTDGFMKGGLLRIADGDAVAMPWLGPGPGGAGAVLPARLVDRPIC
jgi:hypothetical protein